ncbi:MAG: formamidopyrimidine-DNA glycosylase [Dermatophilaceae bacterium]
MAEGHAVHGMAQRLSQLTGSEVRSRGYATSPLDFDAAIADRAVVGQPEAHGKHLLVPFVDRPVTAHLHLGMVGRVSVRRHHRALGVDGFPRTDPPVTPGLRWRLLTSGHIADISAPTICEWLDVAGVAALHTRLGPDPLRPDADPESFRRKVARSRRALGHLLLDQSVIAGVGNVYRAEILWRLRLDPWRPGNDLTSEVIEALWSEAAVLLELGLGAGWIVTDDAQARAARALLVRGERVPRWPKVYAVYGREGRPCRLCGTSVRAAAMGQQRIFWCPTCQATSSTGTGD